VRFLGEPVALIAAETPEAAEEALDLIEVEYEEMPYVVNELEAIRPGAPVLHEKYSDNCFLHAKLRHGDIEVGFAAADLILEETYTSPLAQQTSIEPHVAAAQWVNGRLTVWSPTQAPHRVREVLAEMFGLEETQVRVIVPPLGGSYGGKGHVRIEPMVAALAWKTAGRPVKLALTRAEEFVTVTKHAATITIKTGVRSDGALTARKVTLHWNSGAYADASPALARAAVVRSLGPYRLPAAWVDSYALYTNLPPAGAFRGAMSSQCTWAYESHMDSLAGRLGLDRFEFRMKNLLRSGETFATGEVMHDVHFVECLEAAARKMGWERPLDQPAGARFRRGRGLAVMVKSTPATSRSQCRVVLNDEGCLTIYTSTTDMGQGAHTVLAQIASQNLGLPMDKITVTGPDTDTTPYDTTTSASRSTNMMGGALLAGTRELKDALLELAAPLLEAPEDQLGAGDGHIFLKEAVEERMSFSEVLRRNGKVSLETTGEYATKGMTDPETGQGVASYHWHQGAGACEIEVDQETGKIQVLRYAAASFAGQVVNPELAKLQNDGNVIYGLGPALMEEMVVQGGQVVNPNLSDYLIPSFLDAPEELISAALEAEGSEFHGIGEMTLPPVAPAVANALYEAAGVRIRDLPLTAEKVLRAIQKYDEGRTADDRRSSSL
jgi:CO/xanthine dehydrogenase Mo-binding subunit